MSALISGVVQNAPVWVWPLLVVLIVVGLRARHDRSTPIVLIYALPFLGLMSLRSVVGLPAAGYVIGVFAMAYMGGALGGYTFQKPLILNKLDGRVTLRGEWLTLFVLMVIFWMNFAGGVATAIAPDVYHSASFHVVFAICAGLAAGSFMGRAVRVFMA